MQPGTSYKLNPIKYDIDDQLGWVNPGSKRQKTDVAIENLIAMFPAGKKVTDPDPFGMTATR